MRIITRIVQYLVGILFIVSGLVKANDPLGLSYKMKEFLELWSSSLASSNFFAKGALISFFRRAAPSIAGAKCHHDHAGNSSRRGPDQRLEPPLRTLAVVAADCVFVFLLIWVDDSDIQHSEWIVKPF